MASNVSTKNLKDLSPNEVRRLLGHITYENIIHKMLSGEYGEVTGELLENINEEILRDRFESIPENERFRSTKIIHKEHKRTSG